MKDIVITFNNGKTIHYLNSEYHYENGDIIVKEYDNENHVIGTHYYDEADIKEIKYEG